MRGGEKKQDRARMVREVHRLHTPVQEAMKMHTGMKKVVLNHFSLYPTMVLLNCVEISPSELLNHVLDSTVLVRMMTCLLCVHIVHLTLKQATSQRKRQICKDA
jgi:hypothetical protein